MKSLQKSISVHGPANIVYERWRHVLDLPDFMKTIREVRQLDGTHYSFKVGHGSQGCEFIVEITEEILNERIAWKAGDGANANGTVSFATDGPGQTRVDLRIDYEAEAPWADAGPLAESIEADLNDFKKHIETSLVGEMIHHNWQGF